MRAKDHQWNPVFRTDRNQWSCSRCKIIVVEFATNVKPTSAYRVGPQGPPNKESFFVVDPKTHESVRITPATVTNALEKGIIRRFGTCDEELVREVHES